MTLKTLITEEERGTLHEVLQAEYIQAPDLEGYYVIDGTSIEVNGSTWAVENVSGLRNTVQTVRNERDALKTQVKTYEGVDVTEYQRLKSKKDEIDGWDPTQDDAFKTKLEEQNATWQAKYDADVTSAQTERDESRVKYLRHVKRAAATAAISKHAPKAINALLPHVLSRIEVFNVEGSDDDAVWVRDADGKPCITREAGKTGNMTPEELVSGMKDDEDFRPLFPGTGATGSGATGGGSDAGVTQVDDKLPPTERLKEHYRGGATAAT